MRASSVAGCAALGIVGVLVLVPLAALVRAAGDTGLGAVLADPYVWRIARFTLFQASLSALLSVGLAIPLARALDRRRFPGRAIVVRLLAAPLVLPTIVAVIGIVAAYGRAGWVSGLLARFGMGPLDIYGLTGILVAHVFFNLPLAARLFVQAEGSIPAETWRLASQLGLRGWTLFRLVEWPVLRAALPGAFGLVFMLCFTSFAIVLALGGGPRATTMEVAIYSALRYDFDLPRAVGLAIVQLVLCGTLVALGQRFAAAPVFEPARDARTERPDRRGTAGRMIDGAVLVLSLGFVLLPLLSVLVDGLTGPLLVVLGEGLLWRAVARSAAVAMAAAVLSLLIGWAILVLARDLTLGSGRTTVAGLVELPGLVVMVVPPLALGAGLFVLLHDRIDVFAHGLVLVAIVNALMGLPYVLRVLGPVLHRHARQHDRLLRSLGVSGWARFRFIDWPVLRRPAGTALGLVAAFSTGDLGVVALFGQEEATLPLLLYQRLGSYRVEDAASTALVLVTLCLMLFVACERGIGGRAAA